MTYAERMDPIADSLRLLELHEEYRTRREAESYAAGLPGVEIAGRPVEEIAADYAAALRSVVAAR